MRAIDGKVKKRGSRLAHRRWLRGGQEGGEPGTQVEQRVGTWGLHDEVGLGESIEHRGPQPGEETGKVRPKALHQAEDVAAGVDLQALALGDIRTGSDHVLRLQPVGRLCGLEFRRQGAAPSHDGLHPLLEIGEPWFRNAEPPRGRGTRRGWTRPPVGTTAPPRREPSP